MTPAVPCPLPSTHRPRMLSLLVTLSLVAAVLMAQFPAQAQSAREAERRLQKLRGELKGVAEQRRQIEGQRGQASRQLRQADEKVARSGRLLADTQAALAEQERALQQSQERRRQLEAGLEAQRTQLAALLRAAYQVGGNAPLKLLLAQDRVADGNRVLAYHRYLQRERAQRIAGLTTDLQSLRQVEQEIGERQAQLQQVHQQQQQQAKALTEDRRRRASAIADLDKQFEDRAAREKALGRDAKALETLLANLRAAAARAEAERRAAARRAAQEKAAAERSAGAGNTAPSRATKVPPKVASAPAPKVGGLGWPVSGNLLARYGGKLPDGRSSSGVLIGAAAGTTVTAVADGTVVFSDWMTGYGMILIIDHGNGYMSLYAHNDALLRDPGARVKRGESVARVGNSGGQGVTALYFELRRNGQPVDPGSWLQRQ